MTLEFVARAAHGSGLEMVWISTAVVAAVLAGQFHMRRGFVRTCQGVARALGGTFEASRFFCEPAIRFRIEGYPAQIEFREGREGWTRLCVHLEGRAPGSIQVCRRRFGHSLRSWLGHWVGAPEFSVGDRGFDAQYAVKAEPGSLAQSIFRPDRRARVLETLRRLDGFRHPRLHLESHLLEVRVRSRLESGQEILALARVGQEFAAVLLESGTEPEITWVDAPPSAASRCPVCGTGIQDRVVRCETCNAPHHEECWDYWGKCSIYACPGDRPRKRAA